MSATVSEILERRGRMHDAPAWLVLLVALAAHASFLVFLSLVSRQKVVKFIPTTLPVRVVSPASLARPERAAPAPAPKARPIIEKAKPEAPAPSEKALPVPKTAKEKARAVPKASPTPAPKAAAPEAPALDLPSAGSSPGEAAGVSNFGASVSSFDSDFPFAYYVDQLQSLIGANWLKPNVPEGTACVVAFRIQRSGQVTDVKVEVPSALPFYDRAASRSIYAANPLPPLPPEYKGEQLGVHLKFQ